MQSETDLPADVIEAIHANRKIEAIKRLRAHRGIGLKEAKQQIDAYARANPQSSALQGPKAESSSGRFLLLAVAIGAAYAAYHYLN